MEQFLIHSIISPLIFGYVLDAIIGDPYWLPHPIRVYGNIINTLEKKLNKGNKRKLKGALISTFLILFTFSLFYFTFALLKDYTKAYILLASVGVFYGLANHSLIKESLNVEKSLKNEGIVKARVKLSYIVGRDTTNLSKQQIRKAVLETLAENLSDGVIAPLFYYSIGGVPLMLSYKMINTLDSMIGYKSDRFKDFGWFAAKTDDVFNFIPARITAFLMVAITFSLRGFKSIMKFGSKHSSPNAGYPEAALSGILNTKFGGPNIYHGKLINKPYIGTNERELEHIDIIKACILNGITTLVFIAIIVSIYFYF